MSKRFKMMRKAGPVRMWIDGTNYDVRNSSVVKGKEDAIPEQHVHYNISKDGDGKMSTKFRLPSKYYEKINGNSEYSVEKIEKSTNTEFVVPKNGEDGFIKIIGDDYNKVAQARKETHDICSSIRKNLRPLQFIAIPTLSEQVKENFIKFRDEILNCGLEISGMEETIFQKPTKLHLTITVLALLGDNEIEEATKTLNSFKEEILVPLLKDQKLNIRLRGLECMTQNYKKVDVLYAKAKFENEEEDGIVLQDVMNKLANYFDEKGLSKESVDNVKIHVTLINTKYRNSKNSPKKFRRIPINAVYIMEKYADYDFGVAPFDSIHLSLMSSNGEDGFYLPLTVVQV